MMQPILYKDFVNKKLLRYSGIVGDGGSGTDNFYQAPFSNGALELPHSIDINAFLLKIKLAGYYKAEFATSNHYEILSDVNTSIRILASSGPFVYLNNAPLALNVDNYFAAIPGTFNSISIDDFELQFAANVLFTEALVDNMIQFSYSVDLIINP